MSMMTRRDALARVGMICGATVVGSQAFLSGCARQSLDGESGFLSSADVAVLDEVGETILPTTAKAPGAKAAEIGRFMNVIVTDCYEAEDQAVFATAVPSINAIALEQHGRPFVDLEPVQRRDLLVALDAAAKEQDASRADGAPLHYFSLVKQLTLWGYFTSEVGCTQALRYNPIPGRYDGCVDYVDGDRAWSAI